MIPRNASLKDLVKWPSGGACKVHRSGKFNSSAKILRPGHLAKCKLWGSTSGIETMAQPDRRYFAGSTVNQMRALLATK